MIVRCLALVIAAVTFSSTCSAATYQPVPGKLMTRWSKDVSPETAHREYPRPQMVRENWKNLNGLWEYSILPRDEQYREKFDGQILVPFAVESSLSGVRRNVGEHNRLWYRRTFEVPSDWRGQRVLLHFGAVDWESTVWVNGKKVGTHRGGFDPFYFDITDALRKQGPQEVVISVWDPTDAGPQPHGKQYRAPRGIYYTPVTGIWQTVWLEAVPQTHLARLTITPDIDAGAVTIAAHVDGKEGESLSIKAIASTDEGTVAEASGPADKPLVLKIDKARLWSPDDPFLYDLRVSLVGDGGPVDEVESYFGMRKTAVAKDDKGVNRLMLNNKPLFQYGFLDQGWWPDGLYTAPTDEALRYDVEMTKKIGMNTIRKHVKVEPARWYYHCDKLGMLVWQDMPSGDRHMRPNEPDMKRSKDSAAWYWAELKTMIDSFRNSPAIVMWVPFNEGWGQFETHKVVKWIKDYDPSRVVNEASGWSNRGSGDVCDRHAYPGPAMLPVEENRASVLGEFGGLGLPIKGHLWWNKRNWGYRNMKTKAQLAEAYGKLMTKLRPLIEKGLSAAIYTQTTDVEGEVNGLMTYDREVLKIDAETLREMHKPLYEPVK